MSDANETSIPDPDAAKAALVQMAVMGEDMVGTIEGHSNAIAGLRVGTFSSPLIAALRAGASA